MKYITAILLILFTIIHHAWCWCQLTKFADIGPVLCTDYSPDGTMILTTTATSLTIWQRATKKVLFKRSLVNGYYARFSRSSPSTYIGISSNNSMVELISGIAPFGTIQTFDAGHSGSDAVYLDFYSSTVLLTCGGQTNRVKLWDVTVIPASNTFVDVVAQMSICAFSSSTRIGTATTNNKLRFDSLAPTGITNIMQTNANGCKSIAFSPTGAYMLGACSSSGGTSAYFVATATSTTSNILSTGDMYTTSFSGDGQTFCYGGNTNLLYILNGTSGNKTILSQFVTNSFIQASDFSNDGLYLLAGTQDGTVYQYAKYCLACRPGYYANLTTKLCVQCQTTLQGCSNCLNSTHCVQCYENYIYNSSLNACEGCYGYMEGCSTCLNSSICKYCIVGYYLVNNACVKCESALVGCLSCNSTAFCFQCQSDFYLQSTNYTCVRCQYNNPLCIKCVNTSYCTTCKVGYYQSGGVCTACPTNCYMCQSSNNCTDCLTGYYPLTSGGSTTCTKCTTGCLACNATNYCRNCDDQRYLDNGACPLCPYPCTTCNSSAYCLSCETAHFFDGAGGCTQCSSGCASCNTSSICLSCSPGYYLDLGTSTCLDCQSAYSDCMECTNTTCLKCSFGFYLTATNTCSSCLGTMFACSSCRNQTSCEFCSSGFYSTGMTGNSSCQICILGCATCISSVNCTSCNVGYYYNSATSTCIGCANNCVTCSSSTFCLQCEVGYRLAAGGACTSCSLVIPRCQSCIYNYTAAGIWCLSCSESAFVDPATGLCTFCPNNCTTCLNSSYCSSCQIGMYLDSVYSCQACHNNCSQCAGLPANCTSCVSGYYLTTNNTCQHCSVFGCATCNSSTHDCLSCQTGFYIKTVAGLPSKICDNCLTAITHCYICSSQTVCIQCSYGYALASNQLSCSPCAVVQGCKHCTSLSSCQNCDIGYYLTIDGSGNGICIKCGLGCKECDQTGVCLICFVEYSYQNVSGVISCQLCEITLSGCLICLNDSTCLSCQQGYFLNTTINNCQLCSSSIYACQYCNSSSICTRCQDSYYLSSNSCLKCQGAMIGCQVCNSSSICLACEFGMYLSGNLCYKCSVNLPNCLYCQNLSICLQCDAGSYLGASGCLNCQAQIPGCIQCSSASNCIQCKGGYYLNSGTNLCSACTQQGCQICQQSNPLDCIKCNARYYMNSTLSTCVRCRSEIDGCLQCINSTQCLKCDPGYYLNSSNLCQLCQSNINGCGRCASSTACLQCKSTFYLHTDNTCRECKQQMPGCSFCINGTVCQSCYHGYYKTSSLVCESCTTSPGCLSCLNSSYCQYCENSYFLGSDNVCYTCSALEGCYACTSNSTCAICTGGYILNDEQLCEVMRVQANQAIEDIKLVTQYLNQSCLIHYLYARDMAYIKTDGINWTKTTKIILQDSKYAQTKLQILKVQWGNNNYTLIFYTNNPLQLSQNNLQIARRVLVSGTLTQKYKVNLQMDQATINTILPDFFMPRDLVMNYDLNSAEFVKSYAGANPTLYFYSIFGYFVTCLLIVKYIVKASYTAPHSPEIGQLIPQILALKSPAYILYPSYLQWMYYCMGFTIPEFPWANQFFGSFLADQSDKAPAAFAFFYKNLNIGSTYITSLVIILFLTFVFWLLYYSKKHQEYLQHFPIGSAIFYIFLFGSVWAGAVSFQGALLNPIQSINLNSGFYMIGISFYCIIFGICLYLIYQDRRRNLPKLRIFIKASLLAFANYSPIYIFCSCVLIDIIILVLQHNFINSNHCHPRIWLAKNILTNIALCVLAFWTVALLSLIFTSLIVLVVIALDIFTHHKEHIAYRNKRRVKMNFQNIGDNQSSLDVNVWNIKFEKDDQNIKGNENQRGIQKEARETGFHETKATNLPMKTRNEKYEFRKKIKKSREAGDRPQIINIHQHQKIQKQEVKDLNDNIINFIAQTNNQQQ